MWPPLLAALFVALVLLAIPVPAPDLGIDTAWSAVLNWAHLTGVQFGQHLVFTYGPLGYLIAPYTLQAPPPGLIWANAALCFAIALGLCLVAWRLGWLWRSALLVLFVVEMANTELRIDPALEVGLFCWALFSLVESGSRRRAGLLGLALLSAFAGLAKVIYLFVGGFTMAAVAVWLVAEGEARVAGLVLPGYGLALLAGWLGCGQSLTNFMPYLAQGFLLSRGYDQAAAMEGMTLLQTWGIWLALTALAGVVLRLPCALGPSAPGRIARRAVLGLWMTGLLLLVWKHSLVRIDREHFMNLALFVPAVTLALDAFAGTASRWQTAARVLAGCCAVLSLLAVDLLFLSGPLAGLRQVASQAAYHARCLWSPANSGEMIRPQLTALRDEAQLPHLRSIIGPGKVDVFGSHQAHALLNNLNYQPRPVFQSYAAYSPQLSRLNEMFYLSTRAPQFVLFQLAGLEHRFAAIDDARALRGILINYRFVASEGSFLLLERDSREPVRLSLVETGAVKLASRIDLAPYAADNLWLEIDARPTVPGRILGLLYRPTALRLSVWAQAATTPAARRRIAPSLLRTGFLASPFLRTTADVQRLYNGQPPLRPTGFSLDPQPGTENLWEPEIRFRLYRIENSLPRMGTP